MSNEPSLESEQERRLQEVLAEYISAIEAGRIPDRAALLERHPDLADELILFFANQEDLAVRSVRPKRSKSGLNESSQSIAPTPSDPKPRIKDFEILHELARGGMGVVYKARQISLGREVALKMILTNGAASPTLLRRFQIEVEAAARLDHPNIVPVYEVGESDGDPFFTMKLVEGGSLSSRIDEYCFFATDKGLRPSKAELRQRLRKAAEVLSAVARAVHHAHLRGILHRDLKPGNILLDADGRPMVADFGLAKRVDRSSSLTQTQAVIGTAAYMAPEQARPGKQGLTTAADVYSLGAILYVLLTGRPPIVGSTALETLIKVSQDTPVAPRQRNPNVPLDLELICLHCLEKEPDARYASAQDLADDLDRWRAGEPISLRKATAAERAWRSARRHPVVATLGATIMLLMPFVTIASMHARNIAAANAVSEREARDRAEVARADAESARLAADLARAAAEKAGLENHRLLAFGYVANGTRALDDGDPFGALVWYGEALNLDQGDSNREEPHRVRLAEALRRCPRLVQAWFDNDPALSVSFSPDGRRVAQIVNDTVQVRDVITGSSAAAILPHRGPVVLAGFGFGGSRLFTIEKNGSACIWNSLTGKPLSGPLVHDKAITTAAFNSDGTRLATAALDRTVRVWDSTGKLIAGPLLHDSPVLFLTFSRDGKHLVTSGGDSVTHKGEIRVWDLSGPKPTVRALTRSSVIHWAHLTPDGEHVVATGGRRMAHLWPLNTNHSDSPGLSVVRFDPNGAVGPDPTRVLRLDGSTVRIFDLATMKPVSPPFLHGAPVDLAVFSSDGRLVASAARDRTVRVWDAVTGKPLSPLLRHGRRLQQAIFSADCNRLLTASEDGFVRVWDIAARDTVHPLTRSPSTGPTATGPDGRVVALTDKNGALWLRDAANDNLLHGPLRLPRPITSLVFSPDGRAVFGGSDGGCRIWDASKGQPITPVMPHTGGVQRLAYTPGGSRVVVVGPKGKLEVFNAQTGLLQSDQTAPVGRELPAGPALTPDGLSRVVLSRSGQEVELCVVTSGARIAGPFRHSGVVTAAAINPEGTRLATATADGSAFLWDMSTARPATPALRHGTPLRLIGFSGDGRKLLTVAEDHSIRVWDSRTGLALTPLLTYSEPIASASLAADGVRLTVRGESGTGAVWDLSPDMRPANDLLNLTRVLSGQELDGQSGSLVPIETTGLKDNWPRLRSAYPADFAPVH
jgi:WD40 repeat protein